jgi:hypothetical protein
VAPFQIQPRGFQRGLCSIKRGLCLLQRGLGVVPILFGDSVALQSLIFAIEVGLGHIDLRLGFGDVGRFGVQIGLEGSGVDFEENLALLNDRSFLEGRRDQQSAYAGFDVDGFGGFEMAGVDIPLDDLPLERG